MPPLRRHKRPAAQTGLPEAQAISSYPPAFWAEDSSVSFGGPKRKVEDQRARSAALLWARSSGQATWTSQMLSSV